MNNAYNIFLTIIGLIISTIFWVLLLTTHYLDTPYAIIGTFISTHGTLFGGIYFLITENRS